MLPERYSEVSVYGGRLVGQGALLHVPAFDAPASASPNNPQFTDVDDGIVMLLTLSTTKIKRVKADYRHR